MANLIALSAYKEMTGITSTNQDTRITTLITSVSQLVKTYCNNTFVDFASSAKTEIFNVDYNEHFVQLTETPLIAVTSVSERESPTATYNTLSNNSEYYVDSVTDTIFRVDGSGNPKQFESGKGAVKVVYTAGYSTLPQDLELAVMDLITYYLKDERKQRQTIAGASLNNQTSTTQRDNVGFPDHIKRVLDLYKNF